MRTDHFADIAADEKRHTAERLFRAMAFSERLQENNCATAILRLGGHYTPPGKIVIFGGTTDGNIERSIAYERQAYARARRSRHPPGRWSAETAMRHAC